MMKPALRFLLTLFTILCCTTIGSASIQESQEGVVFGKACVLEGETGFWVDFNAPGRVAGTGAESVNAGAALRSKLSALESAQQGAARTRTLPDGRVRYYGPETPATNPGPTRGASYVTEHNPQTGQVRSWMESYDQSGNINRVRPKMIDGQQVQSQHHPPTARELGQ